MESYFNFKQTSNSISYEPRLYDKASNIQYLFLGIAVLVIGVILTSLEIWKEAINFGVIFGIISIISGLYRLLVSGKTKIEFNKQDDALYSITPLGKRKKIALSNIYDIITVSQNSSYTYDVTNKRKASAKSIAITTYLDKKRLQKPEFQFIEDEMIPAVLDFLQPDTQKISTSQRASNIPTNM